MPIVPIDANGSIGLTQSDRSVSEITAKLETSRENIRTLIKIGKSALFRKKIDISPTKLFENMTGYPQASRATLSQLGFGGGSPDSFIAGDGRDVAGLAKFCRVLVSNGELDACRRSPETFLSSMVTEHVEEVTGPAVEKYGDAFALNALANFTRSTDESVHDSHSSSSTHTVYAGANARASVEGGFKIFGTGATASAGVETGYRYSHDWTTAHSVDRSEATTRGLTLMQMRPFVVERVGMDIPARTRRCVTVLNKAAQYLALGTYVCNDSPVAALIHEDWYFINEQFVQTGILLDPRVAEEQLWAKVIRGQQNFERFKATMENVNKVLVLDNDSSRGFGGLTPAFGDSSLPGMVGR
jgi:hypothetical protein